MQKKYGVKCSASYNDTQLQYLALNSDIIGTQFHDNQYIL